MKLVIKSKGFSQSLLGDGGLSCLTMEPVIGKLSMYYANLTEMAFANNTDYVPPAQPTASESNIQIGIRYQMVSTWEKLAGVALGDRVGLLKGF